MSPTTMSPVMAMYTPATDIRERHAYGVTKHRRSPSNAGGRAWNENEERYLLHARQQKMPYKHIAAQLNKTELACRLHFHQISHSNTRRRRNTSCPAIPSDHPTMVMDPATGGIIQRGFRSLSPPESAGSASSNAEGLVRLPSIMHTAMPPKLPSILPKPENMGRGCQGIPTASRMYPSLRLETSVPSMYRPSALSTVSSTTPLDMARLGYIYNSHRQTFWEGIAAEYGRGVSPVALEQAWVSSVTCCGQRRPRGQSPITPATSPIGSPESVHITPRDRTSISSILSDAE